MKPHLWPPHDTQIRTFKIRFSGEKALDVGGPYRAIFQDWMHECFSKHMDLFIPAPNNTRKATHGNDFWVPSPTNTKYHRYRMFGRILGMALRGEILLDMTLPPLVWKTLASIPRTLQDLNDVDSLFGSFLRDASLLTSSDKKVSESVGVQQDILAFFSSHQVHNFTTYLSDGVSSVELVPHGQTQQLTVHNHTEWTAQCLKKRLNEYNDQLKAILAGLSDVVPVQLFSLFSASELREVFCGSSIVDVKQLKANCKYGEPQSMGADAKQVGYFWQTLEEMSDEQRSQFVAFARGSSRLRQTDQLLLSPPPRSAGIDAFPQAHTCFFQIHLPEYSSLEKFKERFLTAIYNTQGMDLE
jgi:hypothetical protein